MTIKKQKQTSQRKGRFGIAELFGEVFPEFDKSKAVALEGFSLDKDIKGAIIEVTLAPNESKIISHGLRAIPQYRLILRQTGNGVITDVDKYWTNKTIGLKNNGSETVVLTIKISLG